MPVLDIDTFIREAGETLVIDVRTPAEFEHGHVPGAVNVPLFSNQERAEVGTTYKVTGKDAAMQLGLDLVGPKMSRLVEEVERLATSKRVLVHCWRGGMRSEAVAWLLNFSGRFSASTLEGGYKAFRAWIRALFATPWRIVVLGGMTGSGKTPTLLELSHRGRQVVDLEGLARHKGSAYGSLWTDSFPTQEQFENELGMRLHDLDPSAPVWVEDESRRIGRLFIPDPFWKQMSAAQRIVLDIPRKARIEHLVDVYGDADPDGLIESTRRIERRLGGLATKQAVHAIQEGDLATACDIILAYYDKTYTYGLSRRDPERLRRIALDEVDPGKNARAALEAATSLDA
jgi:tRNA 2-selenouridine synthase